MVNEKLAMVCYPGKSGLTHYSYSLLNQCSVFYKDICFICNTSMEFRDNELNCEVARIFGKTRWIIFKYIAFILFIIKNKIRIIHFQSWIKFPYIDTFIFFLLKLLKIKLIMTIHDVLPRNPKFYHPLICKIGYKIFDFLIVHSNQNKNEVIDLVGNVKNITVIPHGVYDMFNSGEKISKNRARRKIGINSEHKIILFFGGMEKRKGAVQLVKNMKRIVEKDNNIILVMAGSFDFPKKIIDKIIDALNISNNVKIFNEWIPISEVKYYFTSSDIVIMPYKEVSTSGVLKLAYAFQKPIIATDIGELVDVIHADKSGFIINYSFSDDDVKEIVEVLNSTDLLNQYRQNINEVIKRKYSWESIADDTLKIYMKLN